MTPLRTILLAAPCLLCCGCPGDPPAPPAKTYPAGTVLVVREASEVCIAMEEIDVAASRVRHHTFEGSQSHYRRVALDEIVLPRAAIAAARPGQRAIALEEARRLRESLVAGREHADEVRRVGNLDTLGPTILGAALELEPGRWSGILELPGTFAFVRLIEPYTLTPTPSVTIATLEVPFLEHGIDSSVLLDFQDRAVLEIVDPAVRELVSRRVLELMAPPEEPEQ